VCLDVGVAGCCRGREVPEVGSTPEDRLPVKMANARGVSGRRGGRLSPWPDGDGGGRAADEGPSAAVAGSPSFVRASVIMALPRGAERVARLWAICWRGLVEARGASGVRDHAIAGSG